MTYLNNLRLLGQDFHFDDPEQVNIPRTPITQATIQDILTVVFVVLGAIAVMMVVIGAIKYAGSQGDPQAIAKAKGTILYAIVGVIIAVFAVAIVDFVFGRVA